MAFVLGLIYMLVTGAVFVSMAVLFLKGRKEKYNRIYLVCQGLVALWCISQVLILLAGTSSELVLAYLLGNIGVCFVGTFWYYFAVEYTGWQCPTVFKFVPFFLSVVHYLLMLTSGVHHLYYTDFEFNNIGHGIFFYTNVAVTYFFVIFGAIILYRNVEKDNQTARSFIVASVLIPVFLNAVYLSGMVQVDFDITPLGFGLSIILVLFATIKYRFLDLSRELAITNEKLLLEKERNRIAQEVHDTAGHTLTMIQSYMKLAELSVKNREAEKTAEYLSEAKVLTSQGIRELRESINQLRREASYELVTQGIMQLTDQVKEIPVEVTVQGEDGERYSHLSRVIYDTVRETITNTLKYADASKLELVIRFQEKQVELVIGDDGKGCDEVIENNGIRGIKERIEGAGGTVRFISGKGEGFLTRVKIPVKEKGF